MIKRRRKPRRGKASPALRKAIRRAVYERGHGECELKLRDDCMAGKLAFDGTTPWDHGHLVHRKSEGSGGKTDLENCCWGCWKCHLLGLHRGETRTSKPCPPKIPAGTEWTDAYYGNRS